MNTERLTELVEVLRTIPKKVRKVDIFDMDVFFDDSRGVDEDATPVKAKARVEGFCGTAACALGTAAMYAPFNKQGLVLSRTAWGFIEYRREGEETVHDFRAGADFFGLPFTIARHLFFSNHNLYGEPTERCLGIKPEHVADVIEFLVEHYRMPDVAEAEEIALRHGRRPSEFAWDYESYD